MAEENSHERGLRSQRLRKSVKSMKEDNYHIRDVLKTPKYRLLVWLKSIRNAQNSGAFENMNNVDILNSGEIRLK